MVCVCSLREYKSVPLLPQTDTELDVFLSSDKRVKAANGREGASANRDVRCDASIGAQHAGRMFVANLRDVRCEGSAGRIGILTRDGEGIEFAELGGGIVLEKLRRRGFE